VFGNYCVIRYTRTDDVASDVGEAQSWKGAIFGKAFMKFYLRIFFYAFVNNISIGL